MSRIGDVPTTLSLAERYVELRQIGVRAWEALTRLGVTAEAVEKRLRADGIPVDPELRVLAGQGRHERERSR